MLALVDLILVGMIPTRNCPSVGWMPGSWTQNWTHFGWRPLRHLSGSLRLKAEGCRQAVTIFIYSLEFSSQLRKSTENLIQFSV